MERREFIKSASAAGVGLSILNFPLYGKNSPNETLVAGVVGIHSRGGAHIDAITQLDGISLAYLADVDEEFLNNRLNDVEKKHGIRPKGFTDFRKMLEQKDLDVVFIATPDHWHTPAAIMALRAGKHVYVEKPCGHNPREGEMLVEAQQKYGLLVQMGNQQRSALESIQAIKEIKDGIIGTPYFGKAWYANNRGSIGIGKVVPVKMGLDFDLWQGPAPRTPYRDNIHPYNWHWFWRWGTGEICNNGTHEIDICRWALGVDYPTKVSSSGGRYAYHDDWQYYDTQVANYEFDDNKLLSWEGRSCNDNLIKNRGRGSAIYGTEGTVIIDRNGYELYDKKEKMVKEVKVGNRSSSSTADLVGGGNMTTMHVQNLLDGITKGTPLHSPIEEGHKSVLLCHLGNISQKMERSLICDPKDGHIINDSEAMQMWWREYEPGWKPKV